MDSGIALYIDRDKERGEVEGSGVHGAGI